MANKPFDTGYVITNGDDFVVINGEQVTKITTEKDGDNWSVTFYLADGTSHLVPPNSWTKHFVTGLVPMIQEMPKQ